MEGLGLGLVAHGFNVVTIWANDKGTVVVGVIVWTQTRRAIVFSDRLQSRTVERLDLLTILRDEGEM